MTRRRWILGVGVGVLILLAISGIRPYDRATWWMEVAPIMIAVPLLAWTYRRFPLTSLLYVLIAGHAVILLVGGAYTYARVPAGFWVQDALGLSRNPYDKLGHFAQGFVPALVAREVLLRTRATTSRRWAGFLAISIAVAISALYELIEWGAALALGQGADEFLGTQGDPWDTQSDMLMALIGGIAATTLLGRLHDRQVTAIDAAPGGSAQ